MTNLLDNAFAEAKFFKMDKLTYLAPNYERLISLSEEFHCVLDFDGKLLVFNQMLITALKTSVDILENKYFESLVIAESAKPLSDLWNKIVKTKSKHLIKLALKGDGSEIINTYWKLQADQETKLVYAVGNILLDEKESEQTKLARALNFLNRDLSEPQKEGYPLTDIQRILSEKVDKFKLISQNVSDLVCLHDPLTTQYLYVSPSVTELTGYLPEDLVGKTPFDFFHLKFLEKLEQDRQRSEQGADQGHPPKMEVMFKTKEGGYKWIEGHSRPIFDDQGKVMLILSTSRDITDRKKVELEKEIYFNYYKTLGNNIPNGAIFLIDTNYKFIIAEGEEFEKVGRTSDYYVGKTVSEVYDKTSLDFLKPHFEKVVHGNHIKFEYPYKGQHYVFLGSPGKDEEGNIVAGVFLTQNITETKQFQGLLQQTIYQLDFQKKALDVSALVSEADKDGVLTYVNDRFIEASQYSKEELIGQPFTILRSDYHPEQFHADIWNQISSGEVWNGEVKSKVKDGSFVWLDTYIVPFKDQEGNVTKYVFIRFDISERKMIQEKLEIKNFELDSFAYHTSHDLRAPLASILGLTALISNEDSISRIKEMNIMIEESVTKQDDFIKSILAYSQNENLELSVHKVYFEDILRSVKEELSNVPNADRVEIITSIEGDKFFYHDSTRLMIIFKNLISNALKYCDITKATSQLLINIYQKEEETSIVFEDNGVGIKVEHIDKIFEMFYRGTESSSGSGLGLYIVKETVEKLGGIITISSQYGIGTKFTILLDNERKE